LIIIFLHQKVISKNSNNTSEDKITILKLADSLLIKLTSIFSGSSVPYKLLGFVKFGLGETLSAEKYLTSSNRLNPNDPITHMMIAEINLQNNLIQPAFDSLETALSQDFSICNNMRYILLKSRVLKGQSKYEEAIALLSKLMNDGKVKELISSKMFSGLY
jgi:tetratricopeptide (TPR) repeat protein